MWQILGAERRFVRRAAVAVVVLGLTVAISTGLNYGFDSTAVIYLALMVAVGGLAIAIAGRSERRSVGPARCPECDGLVSPNAPYCKHCNATLEVSKS